MVFPPARLAALAAVTILGASIAACGGKSASTGGVAKPELDSDPFALLPPSGILVAGLDLRAAVGDPALGAQIASIADALVPIGEGSSFVASRDVDRVLVDVVATLKVDVAAVLSGRFDVDRIAQASQTLNGTPISHGAYAGFATSSTGHTTWVALTPRTVVAGTSDGVKYVLDLLQKGPPARSLPPWVLETLQTPGATIAVTADFASRPVAAAALGSVNLPWLKGMRIGRVIGNMQPPGLNVAATITYADASGAQDAASAVRSVDRWLDLFGPLVGGLKLQGFDASAEGSDVRCKFALDTQGLHTLLAMLPRLLPTAQPSSQ
jgi:hypothetical protein